MEILEKFLNIYERISFLNPALKLVIEWLFGVALIVLLLAIIFKSFPTKQYLSFIKFVKRLLVNILSGLNEAIDDPIEHRMLGHFKHIGNVAFTCASFLLFLILALIFLSLVIAKISEVEGVGLMIASAFSAVLFYFVLFFKAETGKAILAYRKWKNSA